MPKILFIHENYPAQFGGLALALVKQGWDVLFATASTQIPDTHEMHFCEPGLRVVRYKSARKANDTIHHYLRNSEAAVLNAQGFARMGAALEKGGYVPDIVVAHSGWGSGSLVKVVWPNAKFVQYLEWWYNYPAVDIEPNFVHPVPEDKTAQALCRNLPFLLDAQSADTILVPTPFQASQLPPLLKAITKVQHDGVNTDFFKPAPSAKPTFTCEGLPDNAPVITFATRGMEPTRGFPQFMQVAARLQAEIKDLHVLVAGKDSVHYGAKLPKGESFKARALSQNKFDEKRLHFLGHLPKPRYRDLLQRSTVHAYLTRPFVLSWSLVEAMACGCAVVTSSNAAVRDVATDGLDVVMADMDSPEQIAQSIRSLLLDRNKRDVLGKAARAKIIENYSTKKCHTAIKKILTDLLET